MSRTAPPPPCVWPPTACGAARPIWEPSSAARARFWVHRKPPAGAARLPHAQVWRTICRQGDEVLRGKIQGPRNTQHSEKGQRTWAGSYSQSRCCIRGVSRERLPEPFARLSYPGSLPFCPAPAPLQYLRMTSFRASSRILQNGLLYRANAFRAPISGIWHRSVSPSMATNSATPARGRIQGRFSCWLLIYSLPREDFSSVNCIRRMH